MVSENMHWAVEISVSTAWSWQAPLKNNVQPKGTEQPRGPTDTTEHDQSDHLVANPFTNYAGYN